MSNCTSKYPSTYYRVSLKAVIRNEKNEVLVNKEHDENRWDLPGGGWEHDESQHEAMARELYEEVGYRGDFTMQPFATLKFWMPVTKAWLVCIICNVTTQNMDFSVGSDSTEIAFIDPHSINKASNYEMEQWIRENL